MYIKGYISLYQDTKQPFPSLNPLTSLDRASIYLVDIQEKENPSKKCYILILSQREKDRKVIYMC